VMIVGLSPAVGIYQRLNHRVDSSINFDCPGFFRHDQPGNQSKV
jgi:hypothetical protein